MSQANSIRNGLVILIAFVVAIWLGVSVVTEQTETLLKVSAAILILTCIFLGRRIWLLLVFFTALNIPLIRGFSTTELGQVLFIGFSVIMFLMRRLPLKVKLGEKEFWVLLLVACIVQVYFRNPVGLGIFGAGNVGARPYFMITLACLSSIILGNLDIRVAEIKWAFRLMVTGSFLGIGLSLLRMGGGQTEGFVRTTQMDEAGASGRSGTLGSIAAAIAKVVVAVISPLKALLHPFWAPLVLFSIVAAAGSGYRNTVAYVGMIYLTGLAYRSGFGATLVSIFAGAFFLGIIAFVNVVSPLPGNVQRALSPFPGTWEKRHVEAADASTEWRIEMWKEALFTDYWIHNKILGDGLGLTAREMIMIKSLDEGGAIGMQSFGSGMSPQQEVMMLQGGYHSGPVQTIRIIGYVGLVILLLAMTRIAVYAHRQIIRTRGTEWETTVLYMCIPIIVSPIMFVFVFGDFGTGVAYLMLSYAMISLLEKNLPLPAYIKPRYVPYIFKNSSLASTSNQTHLG